MTTNTPETNTQHALLCVRPLQDGETPLHLAAELQRDAVHQTDEDVDIIRILMEHDADITAVTKQVCVVQSDPSG